MLLSRSVAALARRAAVSPVTRRAFIAGVVCRDTKPVGHATSDTQANSPQALTGNKGKNMDLKLGDIGSPEDLLAEGAEPGTVPTDLEQATGLERLELLGKMEGIDIFDMKPLPSDRVGTLDDPIMVKSFGEENYCGCTGCPADSHHVVWLTISRHRPLGRCPECGSCYNMMYLGPEDDPHAHDHGHGDHPKYEEPKTFADFIKPEYYYR